jgi:hypothetical protein
LSDLFYFCVVENIRARSAAPKKVRPLGQPRKSEIKEKRRVRSAEATMASRNLIGSKEKPAEQVSGLEEKPAEQVSEPEEKQVDQVSEPGEKQVDQVSEPEEKQVDQVSELKDKQVDEVSKPDGKQVGQASIEVKIPQVEAGASSSKNEENEVSIGKLQWHLGYVNSNNLCL